MDLNNNLFIDAAKTTNIVEFLELIFPKEWQAVGCRIIETGAEFDSNICEWAPRWSKIPFTVKTGRNELEAAVKSVMYRVHDCFHQLWGLPIPSLNFTNDEFYIFKRTQMCGEVAVLTLSEFILSKILYDKYTDIRPILDRRCAISMLNGPLKNKNPFEIAIRLDDILHKKNRPKWLREHEDSSKFADYYVPMLEDDRKGIDNNWKSMKESNWIPEGAPNNRYSSNLDGLELTLWMIEDFYHLTKTDIGIDLALTNFNRDRRNNIILPKNWGK